uniref:Protein kinase domain-containing protein n=1 Tax=Labrus bergylta TaxID=56723 RepID=A0A3Q3EE45_9LABR
KGRLWPPEACISSSTRSQATYGKVTKAGTAKALPQAILDWPFILPAEQRQLVLREYQLLKRLHHPHLVQLHTAKKSFFLYFGSLRDLYSETQVAELLVQILSAVDYLHSRRVIHLDLKSDNMLVDDGNHLKIADFGSQNHMIMCTVPIKKNKDMLIITKISMEGGWMEM